MHILFGFIIFSIIFISIRWVFSHSGLLKKVWDIIGTKVHIRHYGMFWIVTTVVVSLTLMKVLEAIGVRKSISDIGYLLSFGVCFALMPGTVKGVDKVDR